MDRVICALLSAFATRNLFRVLAWAIHPNKSTTSQPHNSRLLMSWLLFIVLTHLPCAHACVPAAHGPYISRCQEMGSNIHTNDD